MRYKSGSQRLGKRSLVLCVIIAFLIVVLCIFLFIKYKKVTPSQNEGGSTVIRTTPSQDNTQKNLSPKDESSKQQNSTSSVVPPASLIKPYGTFVSNHYPSLSASNAPSQEDSVCTSNPGVTCYIEFTKNGVTKRLPAQTTNSAGSTTWVWDVKKNGFTTGSWTITAIVISGNNQKSRQDNLPLIVSK